MSCKHEVSISAYGAVSFIDVVVICIRQDLFAFSVFKPVSFPPASATETLLNLGQNCSFEDAFSWLKEFCNGRQF